MREKIAPLWCQHCKAMQKTNLTPVDCWYNPLTEEGKDDFCASCEGSITAIAESLRDEIKNARHEAAEAIFESLLSGELIEIGRKAVEDTLIEWRDNRLSELTRGNGLVVRERDGSESSIIRFGPETGLRIGIEAMLGHLKPRYLEEKRSKPEKTSLSHINTSMGEWVKRQEDRPPVLTDEEMQDAVWNVMDGRLSYPMPREREEIKRKAVAEAQRDDTWAKAKEAIKQARREERQRLREEIEKATESEDLYYSATEGWRACRDYILSILEDK